MSQVAASDVMQTLRDRTWEKHKQAERHPFQHALATGRLPRELYALMAAQLMIVHRELFRALQRNRGIGAISAVVRDDHDHAPRCRRDAEHFGIDAASVRACAATAKFIEELEAASDNAPVSLLGALYVLEGATNGGKFIAKMVRRAYALQGVAGTESLDPYGEEQASRWEEFKQSMRGVAFEDGCVERMVAMANRTFDVVAEIGHEVLAARSTPVAPTP